MSKYLIINADDFGVSHGTNEAIYNLYKNKRITSTTIIACAPWANEAIKIAKELCKDNMSVGAHLTHTCEWDDLRWQSITGIKMHKTTTEAQTITIDERINESKKQIKFLIDNGVEIDHIDNHMRTLEDNIYEYLNLAKEYKFGIRVPIKEFNDEGIIKYIKDNKISTIDYLNKYGDIYLSNRETYESHKEAYIKMLDHLEDGINEFYMHPSIECDELKAFADDYKVRIFDYQFLMSDEFIEALKRNDIKLINYSDISKIRGLYEN